jgi:ribonuclease Y
MTSVLALGLGAVIGFLVRKFIAEARISSAEEAAKKLLKEAKEKAEGIKKEALVEAKEQIYIMRTEAEKEARQQRSELLKLEQRLNQREEILEERSRKIEDRDEQLRQKKEQLDKQIHEVEQLYSKEKAQLEKLSELSVSEARELLLKRVEDEVRNEKAALVKQIEMEAKEEAEAKAKRIISLSIQRWAADHTAETTVSVVNLPNEEMKGRIIGREGRNIRAFETLTGINLIIDDTPESVILSSFDAVRREIARLTLEKLVVDGRIHPARIEEMYGKSKAEVEAEIRRSGEEAVLETNVHGLNRELIKVIGKLKYRTSYGQNVFKHSIEVAHLAEMMAFELGTDAAVAKRAGLLHDIGKAIDHEVEGPHAIIGADLAHRLGESDIICHAIQAHHGEVNPETVEAILVQAADAISASRPGARRESLENYIKRLEKLENLAESYKGVERCYAMQAGREVRVMVKPSEIDDNQSVLLAREIAKDIEKNLEYPGQIKVTVIRENRSVEYAK